MTRTRYKFLPGDSAPYFVTATTVNWLPLFSNPTIAQFVIDSLRFLQENGRVTIYAYVLMENHLHLVAAAENLGKEIANFKSFTAKQSIDFYTAQRNEYTLKQLAVHEHPDREHHFWQEGVHPERIQDEGMMRQKIEYIHQNPIRRGYVDEVEHWRYSSARNYVGMPGLLEVCMHW